MKIVKSILLLIAVAAIAFAGRYMLTHGGGAGDVAGGTSLIGGPFTLVNAQGETVTNETFDGQWRLMYFGYTFCPDVCPTSLGSVGNAMNQLPQDLQDKITPLFLTVDPERDTPEIVGQYVSHFHPRMVGLTGSPEQVAAAVKTFRIFAAKVPAENGDPMAYTMDHSSILYLMDPQGTFVTHFSHGTTADDIAAALTKYLGS